MGSRSWIDEGQAKIYAGAYEGQEISHRPGESANTKVADCVAMKYLFIFSTWMGPIIADGPSVAPYKQEVPTRTEARCEQMGANLKKDWEDARKEFGYIILPCRKNPEFKPKGQRK